MNNGLFQQPDMSVQYPAMPQPGNASMENDMNVMQAQDPQQGAPMPTLTGPPDSANAQIPGENPIPSYVGNPILDKYIHHFIGSV